VAALTIPSVVRNYQKIQTVTKLKKIYSALANTTNLAIANEGPIAGWEIGEGVSAANSLNFANKYLIPYLKVSKNCETKTTGDCEFKFLYLNKTGPAILNSYWARFYLTDGSLIGVESQNRTTEDGVYREYVEIMVDINGQKGPNVSGRDVFQFRYLFYETSHPENTAPVGKLVTIATGWSRSNLLSESNSWTCNKNKTGGYCATVIMRDGWQIKDDYPWD
jgi:hypothetical protein